MLVVGVVEEAVVPPPPLSYRVNINMTVSVRNLPRTKPASPTTPPMHRPPTTTCPVPSPNPGHGTPTRPVRPMTPRPYIVHLPPMERSTIVHTCARKSLPQKDLDR